MTTAKLEECARAQALLSDLNCVWRHAAEAQDYPMAKIIGDAIDYVSRNASAKAMLQSVLEEK